MDITISELLKGKPTIIKNKEFFQTKDYVSPFIDKLSGITTDFRVKVVIPDQTTITGSSQDLTYNRVLIQAVLPEKYSIDNHEEVIGFLYGLDAKKPVAKIYRGYLNKACTNLCVFDPMWINIQEISPGDPLNYSSVKHLMEQTSNFAIQLKKLKETTLDRDKQLQYLGTWVDSTLRYNQNYGFGKVKISKTTPIDAYSQLFIDTDSPYYFPEGIDPTMFDVYNSFSQLITDEKDIMNKFEKTILINKILGIN